MLNEFLCVCPYLVSILHPLSEAESSDSPEGPWHGVGLLEPASRVSASGLWDFVFDTLLVFCLFVFSPVPIFISLSSCRCLSSSAIVACLMGIAIWMATDPTPSNWSTLKASLSTASSITRCVLVFALVYLCPCLCVCIYDGWHPLFLSDWSGH